MFARDLFSLTYVSERFTFARRKIMPTVVKITKLITSKLVIKGEARNKVSAKIILFTMLDNDV